MNLIEKTKTILWFLKDSHYRKQIPSLVYRRLFFRNDNLGQERAESWCKERQQPIDEVLKKLGIETRSFSHDNSTYVNEAHDKVSKCPVVMGGPGDLDLLYSISFDKDINNIIESGVAYGWSSLAILSALSKKGKGKLYSIDLPYAKMNNEEYVGLVVPEEIKNSWTLLRKPDRVGIPEAIDALPSLDMCHYDSDKSYSGRKWAYPKIWAALRKGGLFISDDIQDNTAFQEFAEELRLEVHILFNDGKYVGLIRKA